MFTTFRMTSLFLGVLAMMIFSCKQQNLEMDITGEIKRPNTYLIPQADQPIIIDGRQDDPNWKKAPFTKDCIDIEGQKIPDQKTRLKMLWDEEFLYIYAHLEEKHIWATLKNRDTIIFYNNDFEVFISPSNDTHNYGEIEINALGTVWDLLLNKPYNAGGKPKNSWNLTELKTAIFTKGTLNDPNDIKERYTSVKLGKRARFFVKRIKPGDDEYASEHFIEFEK